MISSFNDYEKTKGVYIFDNNLIINLFFFLIYKAIIKFIESFIGK